LAFGHVMLPSGVRAGEANALVQMEQPLLNRP